MNDPEKGLKYDDGKLRWDLLPLDSIEGIVEVLTFGAKKYSDNSWQNVENGNKRYYAAAMRHIAAWQSGETVDPESGIDHLSHILTNFTFLLWLEKQQSKKVKK